MPSRKKDFGSMAPRRPIEDFIHGEGPKEPPVSRPAPVVVPISESESSSADASTSEMTVAVGDYQQGSVVYERRDGQKKRKRVIYLPLELDRQLAAFCGANGLKLSHIVSEFVRDGLSRHQSS